MPRADRYIGDIATLGGKKRAVGDVVYSLGGAPAPIGGETFINGTTAQLLSSGTYPGLAAAIPNNSGLPGTNTRAFTNQTVVRPFQRFTISGSQTVYFEGSSNSLWQWTSPTTAPSQITIPAASGSGFTHTGFIYEPQTNTMFETLTNGTLSYFRASAVGNPATGWTATTYIIDGNADSGKGYAVMYQPTGGKYVFFATTGTLYTTPNTTTGCSMGAAFTGGASLINPAYGGGMAYNVTGTTWWLPLLSTSWLKSTDGGVTWASVATNLSFTPTQGGGTNPYFDAGQQRWYTINTSTGHVFRSTSTDPTAWTDLGVGPTTNPGAIVGFCVTPEGHVWVFVQTGTAGSDQVWRYNNTVGAWEQMVWGPGTGAPTADWGTGMTLTTYAWMFYWFPWVVVINQDATTQNWLMPDITNNFVTPAMPIVGSRTPYIVAK